MKTSTLLNRTKSNFAAQVFFLFLVGLLPTVSSAQNYRTIEAYMGDFGKNEMYIKKAMMDYTITIVESQLDSRAQATATRIIEKINNINNNLKKTDKGFEGNTMLRDSFIKMNDLTILSLSNGSLILNDYEYQSNLSLPEIGENLNKKEAAMMAYYRGLTNYEQDKKSFGANFRLHFKKPVGKNILEYNATQNILFYKLNVMDEKLTKVVAAMDKKGFDDCMNMIALMHEDVLAKTTAYKGYFKDNSLNQANVDYANLINNQSTKLRNLFYDYATAYDNLQELKKSANAEAADTNESVAVYNETVRDYNNKKNSFYAVFNDIQKTKDRKYNEWLVVNANFLKNNGQFENLHDRYAMND